MLLLLGKIQVRGQGCSDHAHALHQEVQGNPSDPVKTLTRVASAHEAVGRGVFQQLARIQQRHGAKALLPNFEFTAEHEAPARPRLQGAILHRRSPPARKAGRVLYVSQPCSPAICIPPSALGRIHLASSRSHVCV